MANWPHYFWVAAAVEEAEHHGGCKTTHLIRQEEGKGVREGGSTMLSEGYFSILTQQLNNSPLGPTSQ